MKLFGEHGILSHPQKAQEHKRYVSSSITPSVELGKRLLASSRSNQRTRPLAMKFHEEWLHSDCPVNAWYKQQTQSSTKFSSIQHWRTKKAPFFHEYLLILLDDGALCRVERMGEGSHRNAIKRIGCVAHDIIQWFSASDYDANPISKEPADLVWHIYLPLSFDLLDVLAICFSIQRTPRCRPYTLQRYNCYFLSLTILVVLARRVGEWEEAIDTETTWFTIIGDVIGRLRQIPCKTTDEYIGLELCNLLDPNHPNPRDFILNPIQNRLSVEALEKWRHYASKILWAKDLEATARESIELCINDAMDSALTGNPDDSRVQSLRIVLDYEEPGDDSADEIVPPDFMESISHEALYGYYDYLRSVIKSAETTYRLQLMEYAPAMKYRLIAWGAACYYCLSVLVQGRKAVLDERQRNNPVAIITGQMFKQEFRTMFLLTRLRTLRLMDDTTQTHYTHNLLSGETEFEVWISASYRAMRSPLCDSPEKQIEALKQLHTISYDSWSFCLRKCVGRELNNNLHARIIDRGLDPKSRMLRMVMASGESSQVSVIQFHDSVRERICAHAKRVGSNGLAAEQLVEIDIDIAMSEVWKQLPEGYGGRYGQAREEEVPTSDSDSFPFPE